VTAEGRSRRERVRLQAAGMFEQGMSAVQAAGLLRPARSRRTGGGGPGGLAARPALPRRGRAGAPAQADCGGLRWTRKSF